MSATAGCWGAVLVSNAKRKVERKAAKPQVGTQDSSVGQALRSVYDEAVGESIPKEMLDLLGKLK